MSIAALDKRLKEIEQRDVYHVRTLADVVLLAAWRARGDPRMPDEDSIVWSPEMEQIVDSLRNHNTQKRNT
jgi:hypothetical protein